MYRRKYHNYNPVNPVVIRLYIMLSIRIPWTLFLSEVNPVVIRLYIMWSIRIPWTFYLSEDSLLALICL